MSLPTLSLTDFRKLSQKFDVPVEIIIRDYATIAILLLLNKHEALKKLIFKGGTAVRRVYFPEARFSVDLDFDYLGEQKDINTIANEFKHILSKLEEESIGSKFITSIDEPIITEHWCFFNVHYTAPGLEAMSRIDINAKHSEDYVKRNLCLLPYSHEKGPETLTYPLSIILEDKLIAFIDRTHAKDLWDIFYLAILKKVKPRQRLSKILKMSLEKISLVLDLISERDWNLLRYEYLPKEFKHFSRLEVINAVREFIRKHF